MTSELDAAIKRLEDIARGLDAWAADNAAEANLGTHSTYWMDNAVRIRGDAAAIRLLIAALKRRPGAVARIIASNPAYLAEVRDEQQTWLAGHLADALFATAAGGE